MQQPLLQSIAVNDAPDVTASFNTLDEDLASIDVDVAGSFSDVDVSDSHTVTVDVASTGWLATVSGTIITFTPPVGAYDYLADGDISAETFTYTVDDGNGGVTSNTVTITVTGSNDGPTLSSVISDQSTAEDALYSYDVSGHFADVDVSDVLSYSAILEGGAALPSWLSIDSVTGVLSGTPENVDVGSISVIVTVFDGQASVSDTFTLDVTNTNDAPDVSGLVSLSSVTEGDVITVTEADLLSNAVDVDGDTLSVANLAASVGVLVDNLDGTWTLTPDMDFNGDVTFSYDVDDGTVTTAATASVTVAAVNDAPTAISLSNSSLDENDLGGSVGILSVTDVDQSSNSGDSYTFTVSDARFEVVDGVLRLTGGEVIDFETEGSVSIDVTAADAGGLAVTETFTVTV